MHLCLPEEDLLLSICEQGLAFPVVLDPQSQRNRTLAARVSMMIELTHCTEEAIKWVFLKSPNYRESVW